MRGADPESLDRLAEICRAVSLEFYVGPPRGETLEAPPAFPPDTESHRMGDRKGKVFTPYPVPIREGHAPQHVGFSPNGCAYYGLDFLLKFDLNPKLCEVVEIFDDSMAPEFPAGAAGLLDLRRTEMVDGRICALGVPHLTVRRLLKRKSGWSAVPDNPEFGMVSWQDHFTVVGQVVWTSHVVGVVEVA